MGGPLVKVRVCVSANAISVSTLVTQPYRSAPPGNPEADLQKSRPCSCGRKEREARKKEKNQDIIHAITDRGNTWTVGLCLHEYVY